MLEVCTSMNMSFFRDVNETWSLKCPDNLYRGVDAGFVAYNSM